jgi:hypothetical protein
LLKLADYAYVPPERPELPVPEAVGDVSRSLHAERLVGARSFPQSGSVLFWRSGSVLAATYIASENASTLVSLARAQQAHIENPTPYTAKQSYDKLVPFENPYIDFPVYWLGPTFKSGHPPSPLRFGSIGNPYHKNDRQFSIEYDYVYLAQFTRRAWSRWIQVWDEEDSDFSSWKCTRNTTIDLRHGKAVIRSGYSEDFARCPIRPPDVFRAEATIGRWTIRIEPCECADPSKNDLGPYSSKRAMEAVARGLRPRG